MSSVSVRYCEHAKQDICLYYETFGDKFEGEPLLLIAGLGAQAILWDTELCHKLVKAGFYVIRYDHRDVGCSSHLDHLGVPNIIFSYLKWIFRLSTPVPPYTLTDLALDGLALLRHLGVTSAHVCGASMGGMLAQIMAIEDPSLVTSLVCISAPAGGVNGSLKVQLSLIWPVPTKGEADIVNHSVWILKQVFGSKYYDKEKLERFTRAVMARPSCKNGMIRQMQAMVCARFEVPRLGTITQPMAIIHGTADRLVPPASARVIAHALPHARLVWVEGMGHDIPLPEPLYDVVVQVIRDTAIQSKAGVVSPIP